MGKYEKEIAKKELLRKVSGDTDGQVLIGKE